MSDQAGLYRIALLQPGDPLRIDQLFKMRQPLQTVRSLQGIAEKRDMRKSGFLQTVFYRPVVGIVTVQGER